MERAMQVLILVGLALYIAPALRRTTDAQRIWLWRGAAACLAIGLAIALVETAMWFLR